MKSALQIQLDNQYEVLRVAYLKKKEQAAPVHSLPAKRSLHQSLKDMPSSFVQQAANWDTAWFSHYE
jgi:hypothetical protein